MTSFELWHKQREADDIARRCKAEKEYVKGQQDIDTILFLMTFVVILLVIANYV